MSRHLTLDLPDDLYAAVEHAAHANAQSPDEWLLRQLTMLLPVPVRNGTNDGVWTAAEEAQFAAEEAAFEAEWHQHRAEMEELRRRPPSSREEARARVEAILASWRGKPMTEDAAIELAMSEEIAEWNLD